MFTAWRGSPWTDREGVAVVVGSSSAGNVLKASLRASLDGGCIPQLWVVTDNWNSLSLSPDICPYPNRSLLSWEATCPNFIW